MEERLIQLRQILACTCGLQISSIPRTRNDIQKLFRDGIGDTVNLMIQNENNFLQEVLNLPDKLDTIYEITTPGGVLFFCYILPSRFIILGPALTQTVTPEITLHQLHRYQLSPQAESAIMELYSAVPVIPTERIYRIAETAIHQLMGMDIPIKFTQTNTIYSLENMLRSSPAAPSPEIAQMRQIAQRYEFGNALIEAIKQGNSSLAFHIAGQYTPGTETTVRNQNPLRNAQNYCIVFNTQLRHAMEQCGIHPYRVDKLSNEIGLQIEQLTEISKLKDFFSDMIRRYCRLVQKHSYPNLSPLINLTVEYIKEHLSDNITVKDTAKALTVNADYLSAQFHQHMGISFIDFVNRERIHQAAALLSNTNLQIQQIAQIIGYNNASYFAKQFARFMGSSPRQYRHHHNPSA